MGGSRPDHPPEGEGSHAGTNISDAQPVILTTSRAMMQGVASSFESPYPLETRKGVGVPQVVCVSKLQLLRWAYTGIFIRCAWVEGWDIDVSTETTQIYLGFINMSVGIIRGIRQRTRL